jgi:hypothetical protein
MQSSRIVPLASSAPAFARLRRGTPDGLRGAVFHNVRSLRCVQNTFAKHLENGAEYRAGPLPRLHHSETVPALFSRTDFEVVLRNVIICAVLAVLSGRSDPMLPLGKPDALLRVRRSSGNGSTQTQSTARVNRFSIVWLAVCHKGIALSAALHLDCARSAKQRGTYDSRGASSMWQPGWHSQCDGGKFRNFCAVKAKRRLPSNARPSLKLTQFGCDA